MFSKLRNFENNVRIPSFGSDLFFSNALKNKYGKELSCLKRINGGTFSICFEGEISNKKYFFKSNILDLKSSSLECEEVILNVTTENSIEAQLVNYFDNNLTHRWLQTKLLQPSCAQTPEQVRSLISSYEVGLKKLGNFQLAPKQDGFNLLLEHAESSTFFLLNLKLISSLISKKAFECIEIARHATSRLDYQLCHGDLGPANVMSDGIKAIAIDWEDVFWGFSGYDYLYWLTFMDNRKWLSRKFLGCTGMSRSEEIAIMVVIILVKSKISVSAGTQQYNLISFDQRLQEVLNLE